ncbi:MAG: HlyD family efflux transporter periplasmic adaptor subunit, partial [Myxococcota bacterium]
AEIGQRATTQSEVVRLAGVATFWITASVPPEQAAMLPRLGGPPAVVTLDLGLGERIERTGRLVRILPEVDPQGRMSRVLIAVDDPLGLDPATRAGGAEVAPLPIGSYVRVSIDAGTIAAAVAVPREAVRENGQVWVRDDAGEVQFRPVEVLWRGDASVLLRGEFAAGDAIITSYLSDPLPGLRVRVRAPGGDTDRARGGDSERGPDRRDGSGDPDGRTGEGA